MLPYLKHLEVSRYTGQLTTNLPNLEVSLLPKLSLVVLPKEFAVICENSPPSTMFLHLAKFWEFLMQRNSVMGQDQIVDACLES